MWYDNVLNHVADEAPGLALHPTPPAHPQRRLTRTMPDDYRRGAILDLIQEHLKSPSMRHIRDPYALNKLAQKILRRVDGENSVWQKWSALREAMLRPAAPCWIPIEDLRDALNQLPGPRLTTTDVEQRLRAMQEEDHSWPDDELKHGCLALYEREKAAGTEMMAIIGAKQEHIEQEEERRRNEWEK